MMTALRLFGFRCTFALAVAALAACGSSKSGGDDDDDATGDGGVDEIDAFAGNPVDFADADPNAPDAGPSEGCEMTTGPACNNCVDDDEDGLADGFDPECTGPLDDDEDSFATGIAGDNIDSKVQDCFFDGNSGAGDDKCKIHTCCLLALSDPSECPAEFQPPKFDPDKCAPVQSCINNCAPLTPPGCDCFGCCTVCKDDECFDVITNPAVAPDCSQEVVDDPTKCPVCEKIEECGTDCNPLECILCPGQSEEDLPEECGGTAECPDGLTPCAETADCVSGEFCSNGCCIEGIG